VNVDIVVPTIGRDSLVTLLAALTPSFHGARPRLIVVEDRARRGPAAARNAGWRQASAAWVAFVDDDVIPSPTWLRDLVADLETASADPSIGAVCGVVTVPMPHHRRPRDWERDVGGLEHARYITADMAYRRDVLERVGGFDEHFTTAYREDADLARRVRDAGYRITTGRRQATHPVGGATWSTSVRRQRGNAADARMRRKHGRHWRTRCEVPPGRLPLHIATVAAGVGALVAGVRARRAAALLGALWAVLTLEFAWRRIRPGPRDRREVLTMLATSALIPPTAVAYRVAGELRERRRPNTVLLDRDGTIVVDVPYNGDPDRVVPIARARSELARLRAHGMRLGVVSNQSGVARGLLTETQVQRVNRRIEELLGPFDGWWYCPHDDADGCRCRKPAPGLVRAALRTFGVRARRCVVIGDTEADVMAASRAGCRGILVPNGETRTDEVTRAAVVAPDLAAAVDLVLGVSP
jgi:histidinol-phosphate phosphatase family protein